MATSAGTVVVNVTADTSQAIREINRLKRFVRWLPFEPYVSFCGNLAMIAIAAYLVCHW